MATSTRAAKPETPEPQAAAPLQHASLVAAISAVMDEIGSVKKEQRNENQRYMFRGIDAVVNAASPVFRRHGVIVFPTLVDIAYDAVAARNGGAMTHVKVIVDYTFRHADSDEALTVRVPGESMDSGDKATPKAMSVAFRIALLQALALPTDEADPESQTYERGVPGQQAPAQPSAETRFRRAGEAIDNARNAGEVARLREVVEQYDRDGTFTPEQAGTLYERCEARVAALEAETPTSPQA